MGALLSLRFEIWRGSSCDLFSTKINKDSESVLWTGCSRNCSTPSGIVVDHAEIGYAPLRSERVVELSAYVLQRRPAPGVLQCNHGAGPDGVRDGLLDSAGTASCASSAWVIPMPGSRCSTTELKSPSAWPTDSTTLAVPSPWSDSGVLTRHSVIPPRHAMTHENSTNLISASFIFGLDKDQKIRMVFPGMNLPDQSSDYRSICSRHDKEILGIKTNFSTLVDYLDVCKPLLIG